jgi:hypothetical protein
MLGICLASSWLVGQRIGDVTVSTYRFKVTGPFVLTGIDDKHPKYLRLTFSDRNTRKLAKGGKWPTEYAQACLAKANGLLNKSVYIKTSQTTKDWDPAEWLCDIRAEEVAQKTREIARALEPDVKADDNDSEEKFILTSCTSGKTFIANAAPIVEVFKTEDDFLDFSQSFEKGFVSAWSAKTARTTKLPPGVKRVRIAGLGERTKRNGFRVVAAEAQTEDTSEAFRFFHLLRVDDKLQNEDYLSDQEVKELIEIRAELEARYPKGLVAWTPT